MLSLTFDSLAINPLLDAADEPRTSIDVSEQRGDRVALATERGGVEPAARVVCVFAFWLGQASRLSKKLPPGHSSAL